ncbi:MAG TPA: hypothetical protein VFQ88_07985 [Nevskiaceae bacterium]|nr:hypothetical protein [Nevskiaceae bacterium]
MLRILLAAWAIVVLVVIGGAIGFVFYTHFVLGLTLHDQPGTLSLPPILEAQARTTHDLAIGLHGRIYAKVPFKQPLDVPLFATYKAQLAMDARMPLQFTIDYRGKVPIHATALVQGTTDLVLHSKLLPHFPLKVHVPLNFELPVHLVVPVDTMFDLDYVGPVVIRFNQVAHTSVDTVLNTYLDVDKTITTPITSAFWMQLRVPSTPLPVVVDEAHLKLPLGSLRLTIEDRQQGENHE